MVEDKVPHGNGLWLREGCWSTVDLGAWVLKLVVLDEVLPEVLGPRDVVVPVEVDTGVDR